MNRRLSTECTSGLEAGGTNVSLVELIDLLTDFQLIERQIHIPKLGRVENDTEHSYNLTMAAWLIVIKDKLPLNVDRVIKYALVHDLVEIYAGDTFALDDEALKDKQAREYVALQKLKDNELTVNFAELAEEYERLDNEESRFVYGLDKLMGASTIIHGRIPIWREHGVTQDIWQNRFQSKIQKSPYLQPYLDEFLRLLEDNPDLLAS